MKQPGQDPDNEYDDFVVPDESEAPAWVFAKEGAPFVFDSYGQGQLFTSKPQEFRDPLELSRMGAIQFYVASELAVMIDSFNQGRLPWETIEKKVMKLVGDAWEHKEIPHANTY